MMNQALGREETQEIMEKTERKLRMTEGSIRASGKTLYSVCNGSTFGRNDQKAKYNHDKVPTEQLLKPIESSLTIHKILIRTA